MSENRTIVSSGNELVAKAAAECGCRFFGGYPITPSSEIMHELSTALPKLGGVCMQMEDEIASISSALGASMSGVRAMTASSGPGISLKAEQVGLGFITEVPLVIVNVMRGGPSTGLPTRVQQSDIGFAKHPTHGDYNSIAIAPANLEECYLLTIKAFNLADRFMQPVFLLLDETVAHMKGKAHLPSLEDVEKMIVPRRAKDVDPSEYFPYEAEQDEPATLNPMFKGYRYHFTGLHHDKLGFPTEDAETCDKLIKRLHNKVNMHTDEIDMYKEYELENAKVLMMAYGSTARSAEAALLELKEEGIDVGLFRFISLWPSPKEKIKELASRFDKILIIELNMGQYCEEVQRVTGKEYETLLKANGRPITPIEIKQKIKEMI